MNITADLRDFAELAALWQRAPEIVQPEMLATMRDADLLLQGELMRELPSGAAGAAGLRGSVFTEEQLLGDTVLGLVATPQPYAAYVELGTKPHMPPIQPLMDWVRAKTGERGKEAKSAAYAIAFSIRERGTKPKPIWAKTYQRMQGEIRRKFDAAIARVLNQLTRASS